MKSAHRQSLCFGIASMGASTNTVSTPQNLGSRPLGLRLWIRLKAGLRPGGSALVPGANCLNHLGLQMFVFLRCSWPRTESAWSFDSGPLVVRSYFLLHLVCMYKCMLVHRQSITGSPQGPTGPGTIAQDRALPASRLGNAFSNFPTPGVELCSWPGSTSWPRQKLY